MILNIILIFNIIRYLAEPELAPAEEDPLQWWIKRKSDYPNLWKMARDLLGIPATSTPSERFFSRAGDLFSKKRNRLTGKTAQALMTLGSWWSGHNLHGGEVSIFKSQKPQHLDAKGTKLPLVEIDGGVVSLIEEDGWDEDMIEDDPEDHEYISDDVRLVDPLILNDDKTFKAWKGDKVEGKNWTDDEDEDDLEDDVDELEVGRKM